MNRKGTKPRQCLNAEAAGATLAHTFAGILPYSRFFFPVSYVSNDPSRQTAGRRRPAPIVALALPARGERI